MVRDHRPIVGRLCITAMAWLRFNLPLEEELEVEKQARMIRECNDLSTLRRVAEQAFRAWCVQVDVTHQLIHQIGSAEHHLAQLGVMEEPSEEHLRWARELAGEISR